MKETRVICFGNQKGGVAKTTTTLNVAYQLAHSFNQKVLLIDMDSQGTASKNVGINVEDENTKNIETLLNALVDSNNDKSSLTWNDVKQYIHSPTYPDRIRSPKNPFRWIDTTSKYEFDVISAGFDISVVEMNMIIAAGASGNGICEDYLNTIISIIKENADYDYVVIDTPPSLGALSLNSLAAAKDGIIITSESDLFSTQAVGRFIATADGVEERHPDNKGILGIALGRYTNGRIADSANEELVSRYPVSIFETKIPESSSVKKAKLMMRLVSQIDKKMNKAYYDLTAEIISAIDSSK